MNILQYLRERNIDLGPLGLLPADDSDRYFCTPVHAELIFRTGVDGVHYCRVKGLGETVFAVEPMGEPGEMVYPVAESVEDFLRLVIACGGEAAVQQCRYWDRAQFDSFLGEYPPTASRLTCMERLWEELGLTPMDDPYGYVSIIQNGFDQGLLSFTEEYYDVLGLEPPREEQRPWIVTYDDGIWNHAPDGDDIGTELTVDARFRWAERDWVIPSVYVCRQGLVMDVCQSAEQDKLQAFIDKWNLLENDGRDVFTDEQQEQIERENPLGFGYNACITVNGRELRQKSASGVTWNPCVLDLYRDVEEQRHILRHYGLEETLGWSLRRVCFPWGEAGAPDIETLSVTLTGEKFDYTAGRFTAEAGDRVPLTHPITGEELVLTVLELEQCTLDVSRFPEEDIIYPQCYTAMTYQVTPPIDRRRLQLRDTHRGDSPIRKGKPNGSVGMAILVGGDPDRTTAVSSLSFAPRETVEWRAVFHESVYEAVTVELTQ